MADVFLSYAKEDSVLAKNVVRSLEVAGLSVWWDQRVTPVETWDLAIERELELASAVLVLWTSHSVKSKWVRTEADYANEKRKLVQLKLSDDEPPIAFRLVQRADLVGWQGRGNTEEWRRALGWIEVLLPAERLRATKVNDFTVDGSASAGPEVEIREMELRDLIVGGVPFHPSKARGVFKLSFRYPEPEMKERLANLRSINAIGAATDLRSLHIEGMGLQDTAWLVQLVNLEVLSIHNCAKLSGCPEIRSLVNLRQLSVRNVPRWEVDWLRNSKNLERLSLHGTRVDDPRALVGMVELVVLELTNVRFPGLDISNCDLSNLHALRVLDVGGTPVNDLGFLKGLRTLEHLTLENCRGSGSNAVSELQSLKSAKLGQIGDGKVLRQLSQVQALQRLEFASDEDIDLSPVAHVSHIRWTRKGETVDLLQE